MNRILFFSQTQAHAIGGMEEHSRAFSAYFKKQLVSDNPSILFFNSGHWIEELPELRKRYPKAHFVYRTGGNEILKAPLSKQQILDHRLRQALWGEILNQTIDVLITNSLFTEERLRRLGIQCPFFRCVGGVASHLPKIHRARDHLVLVCAARFVPYKNHKHLLVLVDELAARGYPIELRLIGDGPLRHQLEPFSPVVTYLGILDNVTTCQEIASADLYIQLSSDVETRVAGGSYLHCEGMGRSILEAISAGTYVIAGRSGALAEIITPDRGLLLEPNSVEALADQIEPLLKQQPPRNPTDQYSWTRLFKKYEDLFENITDYRKILS